MIICLFLQIPNSIGALLVAAIFCVVGVLAVIWAFRLQRRAAAAAKWNRVQGRVINSTLKTNRLAKGIKHGVWLDYEYIVNGRAYRANTVSLTTGQYKGFFHLSDAQQFLATHRRGAPVIVFYDPVNPQQALLDTNVSALSFAVLLVVGVGMLLVAVVFFFWYLQHLSLILGKTS